jgi:hypothetical protein
MSQPIRAYVCPHCGPSVVTLRPGESWTWWPWCPNERPMPLDLVRKWGPGPYRCNAHLTRVRHPAVLR